MRGVLAIFLLWGEGMCRVVCQKREKVETVNWTKKPHRLRLPKAVASNWAKVAKHYTHKKHTHPRIHILFPTSAPLPQTPLSFSFHEIKNNSDIIVTSNFNRILNQIYLLFKYIFSIK